MSIKKDYKPFPHYINQIKFRKTLSTSIHRMSSQLHWISSLSSLSAKILKLVIIRCHTILHGCQILTLNLIDCEKFNTSLQVSLHGVLRFQHPSSIGSKGITQCYCYLISEHKHDKGFMFAKKINNFLFHASSKYKLHVNMILKKCESN